MGNFFVGKRVIITGASGLVGSYLVKAFVDSGAQVKAVIHNRPSNSFTLLAAEETSYDLTIPSDARDAVRGAEVVVHAAGVTGGMTFAAADPGERVAPNALMATNVIHACAKEHVKLLGVVSSAVVHHPSNHPSTEDSWIGEPYALYYGICAVERFIQRLCTFYSWNYDTKIAILQATNVYGRYDNFDLKTSHVLPALLRKGIDGENPLIVRGDGTEVRDFLHASDLASAMLLALEKYARCDPVSVGSGEPVTIGALAKTILELLKSESTLVFDGTKSTSPRTNIVDISKAQAVLGYQPRTNLREGIMDTLKWYESADNKGVGSRHEYRQ